MLAIGQTATSAPREPVDGSSSPVNFQDWQREAKTIESMALYGGGRAVISNQGEADVVPVGTVTQDFFKVFKAPPIQGREFTADEGRPGGPRAIVVSYGLGVSENVLNFTRPDQPPPAPGQAPVALYRVVDPEYFATLKVPVRGGRVFQPSDREGAQRVVVISQRLGEVFWPGENPVDRPIQIGGQDPAIVAGVVANVRSQSLAIEAQPEMYVPHAQTESNRTTR